MLLDWRWLLVMQRSMLVHADNGGIDHLDSGIVATASASMMAAPDTSLPPATQPRV
jgi:hypothetical protein